MYLRRVTLTKVRQFSDRLVSFDFPVTALIGPNGGGKTTILGAAGLAYKDITPGTFFAKSGPYDASMKNWSIEYEVIDKKTNPRLAFQRTASFPQLKWNRKALARPVYYFGVSRTVAATERRELVKAIGNMFVAAEVIALSDEVIAAVERILGKDMQGCNRLRLAPGGKASMFAVRNSQGTEYSEFHFGAGEASVVRIVSEIEQAPDNALILIEEIENGLHPVATRRIVEYLVDVALRKSCQVVFTTHSNEALAPLPSIAIWSAYNGEVLQGKLDVGALRTITGQIDARLAIFVEDSFAELMVACALRYYGQVEVDAIQIHSMGGEAPARKVNEQHNVDPSAQFPSVCILDGDQSERVDPEKGEFCLPGAGLPEAHVFDLVLDNIDTLVGRLAVSLQLPPEAQNRVKKVVRDRALTNADRHVILVQIGEDLDFTSELVVANAFLAMWAQYRPDELRGLIDSFKDKLPMR